MNKKDYISALVTSTGIPSEDVAKVIEAIPAVLSQCSLDGDTVSIPRFGTFYPEFHEETVKEDSSTGERRMLPPEISLHFRPSVLLRKKLN